MLGPVSGTGRAMMASLQQAMSNGMPPDQAIQYVKSMATQGVAPMADLYAMMNQFQRLKQQPVQAPQTPPTIRDQLNMAEQQQMAMQQGLGGLPAPSMEQAQFAGGGIVAFDEGGPTDSSVRSFFIKQKAIDFVNRGRDKEAISLLRSEGIDPQEVLGDRINILDPALSRTPADQRTRDFRLPANLGLEGMGFDTSVVKPEPFGITLPSSDAPPSDPRVGTDSRVPGVRPPVARRSAGIGTVAAPAEATQPSNEDMESREYERRRAFREREGLGAAREEMRSFLTDEGNKLAEQFGKDRMLAFAEAGFKMAAAASRPGATFLGAMSEGAISGTQALRGLQKEMNANRRGLRESMLKLREAEELEKMGDFDKAAQVAQQARTEMFQRQQHDDKIKVDLATIAASVENSRRSSGATVRAAQITAGARGQPGALGADDQLGVLKDQLAPLYRIVENYSNLEYDPTPQQENAYNQAVEQIIQLEKQRNELSGLPGLSGATPRSGASSGADPLGIR
jgi:hypothetical protein